MKKSLTILSALLLAGLLVCCTAKPGEPTVPDDAAEEVQTTDDAAAEETDNTDASAAEETEVSPSEEQAYKPRHYITREMEIEKTLRNVTESDAAYITEWLNGNEALNAYYPSDRSYKPAGRVVIDDVMYYFIYVYSNMTNEKGEQGEQVVAELLLAMDYSEAYECWWLTEELLIYDEEELL